MIVSRVFIVLSLVKDVSMYEASHIISFDLPNIALILCK